MTMAHERTKALINAVEFLRELRAANEAPADMREKLIGILRHLPEASAIELEAKRQFRDRGKAAWLLPTDIYHRPDSAPA
ncbi:MAG: BPSL0761 family protein [Burkholderiaceae bacterium]|nr:BPSL0761 family protein [Burkholderiaceae bacterium]